jgi:hypothetical protein
MCRYMSFIAIFSAIRYLQIVMLYSSIHVLLTIPPRLCRQTNIMHVFVNARPTAFPCFVPPHAPPVQKNNTVASPPVL